MRVQTLHIFISGLRALDPVDKVEPAELLLRLHDFQFFLDRERSTCWYPHFLQLDDARGERQTGH